jgi:hypothetical protein
VSTAEHPRSQTLYRRAYETVPRACPLIRRYGAGYSLLVGI